ncbi:cobyric acid synthase [Clostridium massiliamazoniense]|uniref:cobyric acid synthase n=1 Tax=Clostridium massiliamazoniense TaxID=1347366 RepID=UPI0006D7F683|nr:cobyric acid synthase [Clostridium massiliamazoniense]
MNFKNIMIQGTASSVGKSIINAGLCRILSEDGFKVAPFKSQNMSLNSYITEEGLEMGRAQVVQAEAAGIKPIAAMNPILLKPTGERKCQVIFNGEVYGDFSAVEYQKEKKNLKNKVKEIYKSLDEKFDIIVLEGAGSPAEINLREDDLVNMGMAELVDSPVILVGDIDKGGVFASIYGTIKLLSECEQKRIKGVIINKFRGDVEILKPGLKMLEDLINIPILGVVPYTKLKIDDEDSTSIENFKKVKKLENDIVIKIIRLPFMSNFTDFNVLFSLDNVNISYVSNPEELDGADLIIIPGSKSTIEDLVFLKESGFNEKLYDLEEKGCTIFGICGGFQILGQKLINNLKVEGEIEEIEGLGLLNIVTEFKEEKVRTQVKAKIKGDKGFLNKCDGIVVEGYEIHMGVTKEVMEGTSPFVEIYNSLGKNDKRVEGYRNKDKKVYGTYIHGIFDSLEFTNKILNNIRKEKSIEVNENKEYLSFSELKEKEYAKLSNILRDSLDMEKIYKIINGEDVERNY